MKTGLSMRVAVVYGALSLLIGYGIGTAGMGIVGIASAAPDPRIPQTLMVMTPAPTCGHDGLDAGQICDAGAAQPAKAGPNGGLVTEPASGSAGTSAQTPSYVVATPAPLGYDAGPQAVTNVGPGSSTGNPEFVYVVVPDAGAKPVHEVGPNPGAQHCVICGAAPDGGTLTLTPGARYVFDVIDENGSPVTWATGQYAVFATAPGTTKSPGSYQIVAALPQCDAGTCLAPTTVTCVAQAASTSAPVGPYLCAAPEQAQ